MDTVSIIVDQLLAPYFSQAVVLMLLVEIIVLAVFRFLDIKDNRTRSRFMLIPLAMPLLVYTQNLPQLYLEYFYVANFRLINELYNLVQVEVVRVPSVTGITSITGIVFAAGVLVLLYTKGVEVITSILGVIEVSWSENPELYEKVSRLTQATGLMMPRLGFLEYLEPNAFTLGYGKKSYIVLTTGLVGLLDEHEIDAVLAHEVGHLKNRDYHFSALLCALKLVSFYNPVSHLISSAVLRQREFMADEAGTMLLDSYQALESALVKINEAMRDIPVNHMRRLVFNVFGIMSFNQKRSLFNLHPPIDDRITHLRSLDYTRSVSRDQSKTVLALIFISTLTLSLGVPVLGVVSRLDSGSRYFLMSDTLLSTFSTPSYDLMVSFTVESDPVYIINTLGTRVFIPDTAVQYFSDRQGTGLDAPTVASYGYIRDTGVAGSDMIFTERIGGVGSVDTTQRLIVTRLSPPLFLRPPS